MARSRAKRAVPNQPKAGIFSRAIQWLAERESVRKAPPSRREVFSAHMLLGRRDEEGVLQPVGAFSPELYVMACAGKLAWQVEKNAARLNHADGTPKTPFELAMIPEVTFSKIQRYFRQAITFKDKRRATLPAPIYKLRIQDEFFGKLSETKLEPFATNHLPTLDDQKVNLRNRGELTTPFERFLHYATLWMTPFLAVFAGVEIAASFGWAFPSVLLPFALGYLANYTGKAFATFDFAEFILRDLGWMFDKDYVWKGKWDFRKALQTSVYLGAAGYSVYAAATGTWAATMGASAWGGLAALGAPAMAVTALSMFTAGMVTLTAASLVWFGASYSMRYFVPFTFFNNTIDPKDINAVADRLPLVEISNEKIGSGLNQKLVDDVLKTDPSVIHNRKRKVQPNAQNRNKAGNDEQEPTHDTRRSSRIAARRMGS